ncbi:MAG: ribosomal L7Ae/L30e/S12e/Gadd45 family protein, partial [Nitrososphaerales archaeon]
LCEERNIPFIFVPSKAQLGSALGLDVAAASAAIVEPNEAQALVEQIINEIAKIKK